MNKKETLTLRQYAKRCGTSHQTVSSAIQSGKIVEGFDRKAGRVNPYMADLEWGAEFMQRRLLKDMTPKEKEIIEGDQDWDPFSPDDDIKANTSMKELIRLELLYKARMAKIKVEEAIGKLVNKEDQVREGFEFGKEIRTNLQAIPDRIIDQLITMDRNAAHKLLSESINEVLEKLAAE